VEAYLSLENGPRADHIRSQLHSIQEEFQRFPGDTGSTEVQVAVLTAKIKALAEHLTTHRKDHNSRRGLQGMLNKRRSLLQYLRRTNFDAYVALIGRLGLKDNYERQDRFSVRYKAAIRSPTSEKNIEN
jgi:small subunit ribosomal protein S15